MKTTGYSLDAFPVGRLDSRGIPGTTPPAARVLASTDWGGEYLELAMRGLPPEDLVVRPVPDCVHAVESDSRDPAVLRWRRKFLDLLGGLGNTKLARIVGRCLANRDWRSLEGWVATDPDTLVLEPTPALFAELKKQILGSERWTFCRPDMARRLEANPPWRVRSERRNPFIAPKWIGSLIRTRLLATCWPTAVMGLPPPRADR